MVYSTSLRVCVIIIKLITTKTFFLSLIWASSMKIRCCPHTYIIVDIVSKQKIILPGFLRFFTTEKTQKYTLICWLFSTFSIHLTYLVYYHKMAPAQSTLRPIFPPPFNDGEGSSSSDLFVQPFNLETRLAFGLMLEGSRTSSRERVSLAERQKMIDWITETVQQRGLIEKESKRRSWTKAHFFHQNRKLWRNPDKSHEAREVLAEPEILDAIIATHNSIGHAGQDATAKNAGQSYYGVSREGVIFLVKLCESCHRKAHSKSKGPLVPIISINLFERI